MVIAGSWKVGVGNHRRTGRCPPAVRPLSTAAAAGLAHDRERTGRPGTVLGIGSDRLPHRRRTTVNELLLSVPDISCDHCVRAITGEVSCVEGVQSVDVQLATKTVRVTGSASEASIREAIAEAGYEAA
jgi:copper chaperone